MVLLNYCCTTNARLLYNVSLLRAVYSAMRSKIAHELHDTVRYVRGSFSSPRVNTIGGSEVFWDGQLRPRNNVHTG